MNDVFIYENGYFYKKNKDLYSEKYRPLCMY